MSEHQDKQQDDEAPAAGGLIGKIKSLLKKPLYLAIGGGVLLILIAGIAATVIVSHKHTAEKAKAAAIAKKKAAETEAQEAEARSQREEALKAHQQVLEGVMKAANPAALPGGAAKSVTEEGQPQAQQAAHDRPDQKAVAKQSSTELPAKPTEPEQPSKTASAPEKIHEKPADKSTKRPVAPSTGNSARSQAPSTETETRPASPAAAGSCTLTGSKGASFGEALGKCLEEFNRLDRREKSPGGMSGEVPEKSSAGSGSPAPRK